MSLEARDLSFTYPCGTQILNTLNLAIEPGERVAITGASGIGKTTLCRLLAGYLAPSSGSIFVDEQELSAIAALHGEVSPVQLLWQHPEQAFDPELKLGKSLEEATSKKKLSAEKLAELEASLAISKDWFDRYPHELSGGELMRLAVVRALSARPRYLIADEATAMLDMVTQAQVWRSLLAYQEKTNAGIVVVSHSPSLLAKIASRSISL